MGSIDIEKATALSRAVRRHVLEMTARARSSHIGGAFSVADILAVLYGSVLRFNPADPGWSLRDRFVLSKGHAVTALYAVLAETGHFPVDDLKSFYADGSALVGHATHHGVPGIECSTGSLGHGLPIACGLAWAGKTDAKAPFRVFAVLSDGECDEGSTWEAALFGPHHALDNLTVIIDYNKIQSMGRTADVLNLDPLADKWRSFGWHAVEVDGHDVSALHQVLSSVPMTAGKPTCIVAHTVKGKGVTFMENTLLWHYRSAAGEELANAREELLSR